MTYHPLEPNPFITQADWYVDWTSGNDTNDGKTPGTAVKTVMGGIVSKWGTNKPILAQNTTIHMLTPQPLNAEQIVLAPSLQGAVLFWINGTAQQVASFSLGAVTSKNRATNTPLQAAGFVAGGLTPGQWVHNTTAGKDSWAIVRSINSGVAKLSQPATSLSPGVDSPYTKPSAINTWAQNDTVVVYAPTTINLRSLEIHGAGAQTATLENGSVWVTDCNILEYSGVPTSSTVVISTSATGQLAFQRCNIEPFISAHAVYFINSRVFGGDVFGESAFWGGQYAENGFNLSFFDLTDFTSDWAADGVSLACYGITEVDDINLNCTTNVYRIFYLNGVCWGSGGQLDVYEGGHFYNESGGPWSAHFFLTNFTLVLQNSGSVYNASLGAWLPNIPLTVSNLDTHLSIINPNSNAGYSTFSGNEGTNWQTQATWYIDPVNGNDGYNGLTSGTAVKTLAEFHRRTEAGTTQWTMTSDADVHFISYPPATDPLRLKVKFNQNPSAAGPILTFHPPALTQSSSGTFTAVTTINRATNTPWEVTDGTVDTSGDVKKRIRISGGARAGSRAWVAKSTGLGRRRTSTFADWAATNLGPTIATPQIGDPYVIESAANSLYVDFIEVLPATCAPHPTGDIVSLNFDGFDFRPLTDDSTVSITNGGVALDFANCAFSHGEWYVRTLVPSGDNNSGFTVFENCATYSGQNNLMFMEGLFIDNFVWGGLFGGAIWARQSGGVTVDFDALGQGNQLGGVPGLFVNTGSGAQVMSMGIMDMNANLGACIVQDGGVIGCGGSFSYSGNFGLWGVSTNSGAFGVDIRGYAQLRYTSGFPITITGPGGDFHIGTQTVARAWDDIGGTYTANFNCTWANLFGGSLKDNAHNLITGGVAYLNINGNAQP